MHPNRSYRGRSDAENLAFAAGRGFGTLAVSIADEAPLLSHVPFIVTPDAAHLELHLVRSNPIARLLATPLAAKLSVLGPDSYVSPDWYGIEDQVPTWNYVAVHLSGTLTRLPDDDLAGILERESAHFENRLLPKPPWSIDKMDRNAFDKMLKAIMPCAIELTSIDGTWKLNQTKTDDVRVRAAGQIEAAQVGYQTQALARFQRDSAVR